MQKFQGITILTLAKDEKPHSHVDEDPGEAEELDQVIQEQKQCLNTRKPWKPWDELISFI